MATKPPITPGILVDPLLNLAPTQHELDEKLQFARVSASRLWPYMASAMLRMIPRWVSGHEGVLTMAVDQYWRLYLCRQFVATLSVNALAVLIVWHELQHLLCGHMTRMSGWRGIMLTDKDGREVELVNIANDLAINCRISEGIESARQLYQSLGKIHQFPADICPPEVGVFPKDFKDVDDKVFPDFILSEDYGELLLRKAEKNGKVNSLKGAPCSCGTGAGASEASAPWEDKTPPTIGDASTGVSDLEQDIIRKGVAKAAIEQNAKHQGSVPGGVVLWAEAELSPPKVAWEEELRRVVRFGIDEVAGRRDQTYSRANRRTIGSEVILPGWISHAPRVICIFDTSGSMGPEDYNAVFSEIAGLIKAKGVSGKGLPCIACDAAADRVQWVTRVQDLKMVGGGGTDMMVGIHAAKRALKSNHGLVIVLTDGYTGWDSSPPYPGLPVIAVITNRGSARPPDWIRTVYACDE